MKSVKMWKVCLPAIVVIGGLGLLSLPGSSTNDRASQLNAQEKTPAFSGPTSGKIKIVSSLPRTGSAKGQTDTIVNGIKLALDDVGHKVGDFDLVYEDLDDATATAGSWAAEREAANAQQATDDKDVMAYIGTYNSGAAKISMPILNKAGILMVSPANTSPGLTKPKTGEKNEPDCYRPTGKINYVRVVPTDDIQGPVGAAWAKRILKKEKTARRGVYILDDNEVYGKGVADQFKKECEELKVKVLGQESIDVKAQEFGALMIKIKQKNPGLVYFGGTTQTKAGQLAKDMKAAGLDVPMMVPDGCYENAFISSAGADVLNGRCYITFGGLPVSELLKTENGKAFAARYEKKFGKLPDEAYAAYGYECAKVVIEAIKQAKVKNREAIVWYGTRMKNFDGVLGKWSFDANGDTTLQTMSGNIVQDGKFKFSELLELAKE
jgi:branched-chain amino acid transport system substrate-binding protein